MNPTFSAPASRFFRQGFSVVEIVVVAGIASLVLLSLTQLATLVNRPIAAGVREIEANYLAEEALEAVRAIRNQGWTDGIAPLTPEAVYYPAIIDEAWTLTGTAPSPINGTYTRTVVVHEVYRDGDDDISESGTLDPQTRLVTATVTWLEHGQSKTVTLETYLTNFLST